MKVVEASFIVEDNINGEVILKNIERYGRTCYKSETNISEESSRAFIKRLINLGHESVLEHEKVTVRVICDRGVSHEIVRHRIASYSQESTRYCNYSSNKFGNDVTFIAPIFWRSTSEDDREKLKIWYAAMEKIEEAYHSLLLLGATPQEARSVLPNSLKTEIIMTMNLREWRHFFKVRTSPAAHPQMREIALPLLNKFKDIIPVVFDDITTKNLEESYSGPRISDNSLRW